MCPFVVFIYANKFAWRSGMGDGGWESGKNKAYLRVPPAHRLPNISSQNKKYTLYLVSALIRFTPAPRTYCGRADNACTNLLGFFVRYVRTRGSMRLRRVQNRRLSFYPLPHALATHYFLRLTRARRGGSEGGRRESSLLTFGTFGHAKVRENKTLFMFLLRKLTSRKTSEFHYISLVRKGADYLP